MRIFKILTYCLAGLFVTGCSSEHSDADNILATLQQASEALAEGDYARATELCNSLTQTADSAFLSWNDYCHAAVIYAKAYDSDFETEASMAAATKCISRAREMQPDSVNMFVMTSDSEYSGALNTVVQTLDCLNTDRTNFDAPDESDLLDEDLTPDHIHSHQPES